MIRALILKISTKWASVIKQRPIIKSYTAKFRHIGAMKTLEEQKGKWVLVGDCIRNINVNFRTKS